MPHPVNWFQIQGRDAKEAKSLQTFYGKVFGWKMTPAPDGSGMAMVSRDAGGIDGGISASMDGSRSVAVYVGVQNLEAHLAKIKSAGGQGALDPIELPKGMGRIAGFADPSGNWIGLWQPSAPAKAAPAKKAAPKKAPAKKAAKKPARKAAKPKKKARAHK